MPLANDLKVLTWIANKGLQTLLTTLPYVRCATSEYQPQFDNTEYAKGDTIQIRRVNRRIGGEGATINLDGVVEKTETLTIEKQFNDGMDFTTKEQALFTTGREGAEIYAERYITPSMLRLVHMLNSYIGERAASDLSYYYGAPSTPISTYTQVAQMNARMQNLSMPVEGEKYLIVNPDDGATLKGSLANFFNPILHKGIDEKYFMKELADFQFQESASVPRHTAGTAAGVAGLTVKTDVTSGNTIVVTGFGGADANAFKKGDIITVADSFIVAPATYKTTNIPVQYTVQADAAAVADGLNFSATVTVSPEVIIDQTNPFWNTNVKLTAGKTVTVLGSHNLNVAFCKGGLSLACPKMQRLETPKCVFVTDTKFGTGISLRLSQSADIMTGKNIMRWDLLAGAKFHPEYGIKALT
jgi:hypothetical protein